MMDLTYDYETFSEVSLPVVGTSVYARHPSTEVLMCAYAFDDGPIQQWVPAEGEPMPEELEWALQTDEVVKHAWNDPFERAIDTHCLGLRTDVRQHRDTMVHAMHLSLPGKLEKVGDILRLPVDKQKDRKGKTLMRKFSFPRKPTKNNPATRNYWHQFIPDWQEYLAYNRADVVAERSIRKRIRRYPMSEEEWELWFLDQKINNAGIPINLRMVRNAITIYEDEFRDGTEEMKRITGLANPGSPAQLTPWLMDQGYMFSDLKKGHVERAKDYFEVKPEHWTEEEWESYKENTDLYDVLTLRRETARSSIKKYYALDRATDHDGNLRNSLQFNGASRTARWGGRLFQPQNLPRPNKAYEEWQEALARAIELLDTVAFRMGVPNTYDALASALRAAAQAPDGYVFLDCDLNAIENRVLGWLAKCQKILDVFLLKRDPYISFATYLYNQGYDELYHEYKVLKMGAKRQIAKPGTLGSGYGMGKGKIIVNESTGEIEATGLLGYAWGMGVKNFTEADSEHSINTFRREFKEVVDYWYDIERAAIKCVRTGKDTDQGDIGFHINGPFLQMILPSGRPLWYLRPEIKGVKTPWGAVKQQLTYENLNDRKQWVRVSTNGGKLTENADQAMSRDLLAHGMTLADREGLDIRLHVHDEIVCLAPEDKADEQLKILIDCMESQPAWAHDLPLGTGYQITKVFMKD